MRLKTLCVVLCLLAAPLAEAQNPPFTLSFDQAPASADDFIKVSGGGWPLSLTISIADHQLDDVVGFEGAWAAPNDDWRILLVTENPDKCPSWLESPVTWGEEKRYWVPGRCTLALSETRPRDETWLELRPQRGGQPKSCEFQPKVWTFQQIGENSGGNITTTSLGPCSDVHHGYGPHSGLPNLVLLADAGPGVVTDVAFRRLEPRIQRNLAGFFQNIGFTWRGADKERKVSAHMIAPRFLFSSAIAFDELVSFPPEPPAGTFWAPTQNGTACSEILSFDGGPQICRENLLITDEPTTLRAFLVVGRAPHEIQDRDGNGIIDAQDVIAAGYRLYSNEAIFKVKEHSGEQKFRVDLDGDGAAGNDPFPGSPVDLTEPPP